MSDVKGTDTDLLKHAAESFSTVLVLPGTKKAAEKDWQRYSNCKHHTKFIPDGCNLGIVTGRASNLVVVDVDKPEIFKPLAAKNGFKWEDHFVVKTPKGYHIYFRYNHKMDEYFKSARVNCGMDETGAEILIKDSYILAPGSYIDETGKSYQILHSGRIKDNPPEWLMRLILDAHREKMLTYFKSTSHKRDRSEPMTPEQCWVVCRMEDRLRMQGSRNNVCYWFAGVLLQRGNDISCAHDVAQWIDESTDNTFSFTEALTTVKRRLEKGN